MKDDQEIERERYDSRALAAWRERDAEADPFLKDNLDYLSEPHRAPYKKFCQFLEETLCDTVRVLEIGAGTGAFTGVLLESKADVYATDISSVSLDFLFHRYGQPPNLTVVVCNMEKLPFLDKSFDVVVSAGSLSYGDNQKVCFEIFRVLRDGGSFVCVDSLNHNPIYRVNRFVHYLTGKRSRSTLLRMPTIALIDKYRALYGDVSVSFYGSIAWCFPILSLLVSNRNAARFSNWIDNVLSINRSAFKFVMLAKKI